MRSHTFLATAFAAVAAVTMTAQSPLTTTFAGGNAQSGNMFDIVGVTPVVITGFDVNMAGTATIEVYSITAGTTYVGNETNPAAWTLLGTAPGVVGAGLGVPTPVPLILSVPINPGQVQGFYVTVTTGTLAYTAGSVLGSVFASNSDIQFREGVGKAYPFGATFTPRVWNGRIHYVPGAAGGFATKTLYGAGCYDLPRMAHQLFPGDTTPVDLVNTQWSLLYLPGATGGNYIIVPTGNPYDGVTPAATGINLASQPYTTSSSANWDDASVNKTLPFAFPYPNATSATTNLISVNSNGRIYLGNHFDGTFASNGANSGFTPTSFRGTTGVGLPVIAGFMCDLDAVAGGQIWYEDPSPNGGVRITWECPNWQDGVYVPAQIMCKVQMELLPNGNINLAYGTTLGNTGSINNDANVGYSGGGTQPPTPSIDWSTLNGYVTGNGLVALAMNADVRPLLGATLNLTVSEIPAGSIIGGIIYGFTNFGPAGIPLGFLGMPGCQLYASPDLILTGVFPGATYVNLFPIPPTFSLAGISLAVQGMALNSGIPNAFQGITSNGVSLTLGNL